MFGIDDHTWGTIVRPGLALLAMFVAVRVYKARQEKKNKNERKP